MGCGGSTAAKGAATETERKYVTDDGEGGPPPVTSDSESESLSAGQQTPRSCGRRTSASPVPKLGKHERIDVYRKEVLARPRLQEEGSPTHTALKDDVFLVATLAIESSPCPAMVLSESGLVVALNHKMCEAFDVVEDRFPPDANFTTLLRLPVVPFGDPPQLTPLADAPSGLVATGLSPSGQEFPIMLRGVELPFGDGGGWVVHVELTGGEFPSQRQRRHSETSPAPASPRDSTTRLSPRQLGVKRGGAPRRRLQNSASLDSIDMPILTTPRKRRASQVSGCSSDRSTDPDSQVGAQYRIKNWGHGDVLLTVDPTGAILGSSPGARRLFSRSEEQLMGADVDVLISTLDDDRSLRSLILDGEANLVRGEEDRVFSLWRASEGVEQVWVNTIGEMVWNAEAQMPTVWYTVRFLPLENAKEGLARGLLQALRKSTLSEEITAVFEGMARPSLITTDEGIIIYINEAALRLTGYRNVELQDENVGLLVPHPWKSSHSEKIRLTYLSGSVGVLRGARGLPMIKKSGRIISVKVEISQLATPKGQYVFVCHFREIMDLAAAAVVNSRLNRVMAMMTAAKADTRNNAVEGELTSPMGSVGSLRKGGSIRSLRSLRRNDLIRNSAASLGSLRSNRSFRSPSRRPEKPIKSPRSETTSGGSSASSGSGLQPRQGSAAGSA
eukprot:Hpha_TRINITY_DN11345_c0_g1::TRINITY_DN11345_c0_g1_i1::g.62993::m.62993